MSTSASPSPPLRSLPFLALLGLVAAFAATVCAQAFAAGDAASSARATGAVQGSATPDGERVFAAIVHVQVRAVPDARSAATLGPERDGSGIVIGDDGLVLTIGYLIVEADDVRITDAQGRVRPAQVVGYDHATGFGLVRSLVPLGIAPLPLGDSARLEERTPVMIANHHGVDDVTFAYVVSRRRFTASWEYILDEAIFTSPPALDWSGAALIGKDGRLLGVGSLVVRDAVSSDDTTLPGNLFVPINALKPVLADMVKTGRRAGPARPWLGVAADEVQGRLFVSRVSPEGPADRAGIRPGDIILGVDGTGVGSQADFYARVWSYGAAGTDIPLRVLQGLDVHELQVHSIDRVDYFRPQTMH